MAYRFMNYQVNVLEFRVYNKNLILLFNLIVNEVEKRNVKTNK